MKMKVIAIVIISMFLLSGISTVPAKITNDKNQMLVESDVHFSSLEKGRFYFFGYLIPKIFSKRMNIDENTVKMIHQARLSYIAIESYMDDNIHDIYLFVNGIKYEKTGKMPFEDDSGKPIYIWIFEEKFGVPRKWTTYEISFEAYDAAYNVVASDSMNLEIFAIFK